VGLVTTGSPPSATNGRLEPSKSPKGFQISGFLSRTPFYSPFPNSHAMVLWFLGIMVPGPQEESATLGSRSAFHFAATFRSHSLVPFLHLSESLRRRRTLPVYPMTRPSFSRGGPQFFPSLVQLCYAQSPLFALYPCARFVHAGAFSSSAARGTRLSFFCVFKQLLPPVVSPDFVSGGPQRPLVT